MKRADIKVGEAYNVQFSRRLVTCTVISKHLFGFLIRCKYMSRCDRGCTATTKVSYRWSWNFIEEW